MYDKFGPFTLGIVFAHEIGHAIQTRAGVQGPTILIELQADCFAGAWTKDVAAGNADHFEVKEKDLDASVAGFLELRDGIEVSETDPVAHGTGFDRVGAFQDGFEEGVSRCARYDEDPPVVVETGFTSQEDFDRGGNLPLDQILADSVPDLEDFWSVLFGQIGETWTPVTSVTGYDPANDIVSCGGDALAPDDVRNTSFYCVADDAILFDETGLIPDLYEIGDYAVADALSKQYAYAAQVRLGITENSIDADLQADCFSGIYASSGFLANRENQILVLSPGDLDEAIIGFLAFGDSTSGTAFQRIDAFRAGFIQGFEACNAILPR